MPLGGTDSAVAVHCPGVGPALPGAVRGKGRLSATHSSDTQAFYPLTPNPHPNLYVLLQPSTLAPTTQLPDGKHLDRTGGRMLGLWLAPCRRGGRLWLVGMELRGMVWIGLVNSGYRWKERDNQC